MFIEVFGFDFFSMEFELLLEYTLYRGSSRKVRSNADLCNDLREFISAVGLPQGHVPSLKELSQHGRFLLFIPSAPPLSLWFLFSHDFLMFCAKIELGALASSI